MADLTPENLKTIIDRMQEWDTLQIVYSGGGVHKLPDGGYFMQAEVNLVVRVPASDYVTKFSSALKGDIDLSQEIEALPVLDELESAQTEGLLELPQTTQE